MNELWISLTGLILSIVVVYFVGRWLIKDDRAKRKEARDRHKELINAIKSSCKANCEGEK
jgi:uncharacterized membrane protein YdjX (TVP38/TMEM64 family)